MIGVLLLASLALPLLTEAASANSTFTNDGYFKMTKYGTTDEITIIFDSTDSSHLTVNDELVTLPDLADIGLNVSLIASEIFCLRYNTNSTFQCFSGNSNTGVSVGEDWSFTATGGTATFTNTTTNDSRTITYDNLYIINNDGDWVMKKSTVPAYVNDDSFFMGVGLTAGSSAIGIVGLNVSGSIEDGATITAWRGTGLTFTDIEIDESSVNSHINLYKLNKVTFTATDADNDTLDITYSYFIVPYQVTAEKATHLDNTESTLIDLIPLLLAVALVLGIIAYAIRARLS